MDMGAWLEGTEGAMMRWDAHSVAERDGREACGLIIALGVGSRLAYVPCDNVAIAADEYMVDPERHKELIDAGVKVVGVFHSHVNAGARASELDMAMAQGGLWYVIYSVRDQEFNWWLQGDEGG